MAVGLAAATANSILSVLRNTAFAAISAPVTEMHTADPGAAGTTAVSAGSSSRNATSWAAPSGGSMALSASPTAWTNGGTSETLSHLAIWTASAGTFFQSGALTTPQAWVSTNTFTLTTLTLNYTPIAA